MFIVGGDKTLSEEAVCNFIKAVRKCNRKNGKNIKRKTFSNRIDVINNIPLYIYYIIYFDKRTENIRINSVFKWDYRYMGLKKYGKMNCKDPEFRAKLSKQMQENNKKYKKTEKGKLTQKICNQKRKLKGELKCY